MDCLKITLRSSAISWGLAAVALTLVVVNMAFQSYRLALGQEHVAGLAMMSLDKENNVPALFATLLLLAAALILAFIALLERKRAAQDAIRWALLAGGFLVMAVDESLAFHERLIDPVRHVLASLGIQQLGIFYFAWVIPGILGVAALGAYFLPFVLRLPKATGAMLMLAAATYLGGALGVELVEGWWREMHGHRNIVYHALVSLEEGMEMLGVILLIRTLLGYLASTFGQVQVAFQSVPDATGAFGAIRQATPAGKVRRSGAM